MSYTNKLDKFGLDPFGTVSVAMVTPFTQDDQIDIDKAVELANVLIDKGCNGIVLNGTTGEAPTTQPEDKLVLLKAIRESVGDRAKIVHGCGTYDTAESVDFARNAQEVGCDGLLVVSPYYSRPSQEGIFQHFTAVANSTDLPVLVYDIPPRSVVEVSKETILRLAENPNIVGVKDAKGDLQDGAYLIKNTDLIFLSGDDPLNLPWLSVGAVGFVSVIGHLVADRLALMLKEFQDGNNIKALEIHNSLHPLFDAMSKTGGVTFTKASLKLLGMPVGLPRLPQVEATKEQYEMIEKSLAEAKLL